MAGPALWDSLGLFLHTCKGTAVGQAILFVRREGNWGRGSCQQRPGRTLASASGSTWGQLTTCSCCEEGSVVEGGKKRGREDFGVAIQSICHNKLLQWTKKLLALAG